MKNKAFTLIELLVVVLIIGILAAVALPQYQTAVNKSRYAGLMPLAKSVKDAEEAQLMATGHYTAKLEDLSVQVPGTIEPENTATGDHVTIELYNGEGDYDFVKATDTRNPANTYVMYFAKSGNFKGEIHCEAEQNNAKAKQLCLSYGPTAGPFTGTDSGYDAYVLQGTGDGTGSGVPLSVISQISDAFRNYLANWVPPSACSASNAGTDECLMRQASFGMYGGYSNYSSVELIGEDRLLLYSEKKGHYDLVYYENGTLHGCVEYTGGECLGSHF